MTATEDSDLLTHLKVKPSKQHRNDEQVNVFNFFPSVTYLYELQPKNVTSLNEKWFNKIPGFITGALIGLFFHD